MVQKCGIPQINTARKFGGVIISLTIDISDSDRDTAKLDYLDMVLGAGFETENLYERVYRNYNAGLWTNYHVRKAVEHGWINETDYENLTGEPYATDEEENTDDQD